MVRGRLAGACVARRAGADAQAWAGAQPPPPFLEIKNHSCSLSQEPVQKRFLPQKGGSLSAEGAFAKKFSGAGSRFRCRRLRSAAVTRLWPRGLRSRRPHSSLISGLLGLEGIFKRHVPGVRSRPRSKSTDDLDRAQGRIPCDQNEHSWSQCLD